MKKYILLLIFLPVLLNCAKEKFPNENITGKFSLSRLGTLKSTSVNETADSTFFDLDSLKSSKSFYFILANSGEEDITNVTITTNNVNFSVSPSAISVLPGKSSTGDGVIVPVISLDVTHGMRVNGIGYDRLLEPGINSCNIHITGQTSNGSETVEVSMTAKVQVFAKVLEVQVWKDGEEVDLSKPHGVTSTTRKELLTMMMYRYDDGNQLSIKNTGNVKIELELINGTNLSGDLYSIIQSETLLTGDSVALNLPYSRNLMTSYISLDAQGTISDPNRLRVEKDGIGYMCFLYWPEPEVEEPKHID